VYEPFQKQIKPLLDAEIPTLRPQPQLVGIGEALPGKTFGEALNGLTTYKIGNVSKGQSKVLGKMENNGGKADVEEVHDQAAVSKGTGEVYTVKAEDVISERVKDFDLREHPVSYKQLSAKKMKELKLKIENRTITKEEYQSYIWNKKFARIRDKGVVEFWKQERIRILNGETPTRNWSNEQIEDILNKKRAKFNGQTLQGHHTYSAAKYPHLADEGEVMYPLTYKEHFYGWHGRNYKNSLPGKPIKEIIEF
jgi:toxin YxiD